LHAVHEGGSSTAATEVAAPPYIVVTYMIEI
jgi:hypothetical protein